MAATPWTPPRLTGQWSVALWLGALGDLGSVPGQTVGSNGHLEIYSNLLVVLDIYDFPQYLEWLADWLISFGWVKTTNQHLNISVSSITWLMFWCFFSCFPVTKPTRKEHVQIRAIHLIDTAYGGEKHRPSAVRAQRLFAGWFQATVQNAV